MDVATLARDLTVHLLQGAEMRVAAFLAEPSVLVASSHEHPSFLGVSHPASAGLTQRRPTSSYCGSP